MRRESSPAPGVDTLQPATTELALRLAHAVDGVRDYAIFLLDADGRVATWNAGAAAIKGYAASDIVGRHIETFYTPEDRAAGLPAQLLRCAETEGRVENEGWRVRKDGTRFWADVVITASRDPDGTLVGFAKVTRDRTESRRYAEALRRSEERLRLLVESVHDYAIFMLDPSGRVATWNVGAQRIKGYAASEIIGQHFSRFYPPADVAAGKCELELALAVRDGSVEDEGWRVRKNGTRFWATVVITAVRDADGQLLGFSKVTRDLTERRRAEDERVQLAQAEAAIRIRDEFLSIASHELRTPLMALQLQLDSLQEELIAEGAGHTHAVERAVRNTQRLGRLIDSLLDVSRIATGTLSLHRERFDLRDAIAHMIDDLGAAARAARCEIEVGAVGPVVGDWDRLRVEQVIANLLSNSIKFAAGKPILISLGVDDGEAVLEVRDHGPGVATTDLLRIFDRFERAASTRHYAGLGLGLYVAREIAEAHGGSIAAGNHAGGGARFVVRLPRVTE